VSEASGIVRLQLGFTTCAMVAYDTPLAIVPETNELPERLPV
jgi:hypothetical protein